VPDVIPGFEAKRAVANRHRVKLLQSAKSGQSAFDPFQTFASVWLIFSSSSGVLDSSASRRFIRQRPALRAHNHHLFAKPGDTTLQ